MEFLNLDILYLFVLQKPYVCSNTLKCLIHLKMSEYFNLKTACKN